MKKHFYPAPKFHAAFLGHPLMFKSEETLKEVARILTPDGWFACLWDHRDLDDPLQRNRKALYTNSYPGLIMAKGDRLPYWGN